MNGSEEVQAYFGAAAGRLGQAAGLGAAEAGRVLRDGLPLQLAALTEHARTPGGARQVAEAVQSLPRFASAEVALAGTDAASTLQRAGQLLGPALLGPRAEAIAREVVGPSHPAGVQKLLQMTLPLVLSFLGQRMTPEPGPPADREEAAPGPARIVVSALPPGGEASGGLPPGPSPQALAGFLRAHLGEETAGRLGTLAGYGGSSATRAAQAALPVVLAAVARKGRGEAGAGVFLSHSGDFERLVDAGGGLNPHLLGHPARVAQIEGQGRGLLGTLFGTPDAVAGRLGAALGGPGEEAARLLALLTPLVLGLLVGWARAQGLDARHLSALLAGLGPHLPGLAPAGLPGLEPLLTTEGSPAPARVVAAPGCPRVVDPAAGRAAGGRPLPPAVEPGPGAHRRGGGHHRQPGARRDPPARGPHPARHGPSGRDPLHRGRRAGGHVRPGGGGRHLAGHRPHPHPGRTRLHRARQRRRQRRGPGQRHRRERPGVRHESWRRPRRAHRPAA